MNDDPTMQRLVCGLFPFNDLPDGCDFSGPAVFIYNDPHGSREMRGGARAWVKTGTLDKPEYIVLQCRDLPGELRRVPGEPGKAGPHYRGWIGNEERYTVIGTEGMTPSGHLYINVTLGGYIYSNHPPCDEPVDFEPVV